MGTTTGLSSTNSDTKPPIFILGCQRSGTSLLRRVLDSHSNIACPPESAFLVQLARVFEIKRALQGLLDMGFCERDVLDQMRIFISRFFESYAKSKGKRRWADKTAHYVDHTDTIDLIFRGKVLYIGIIRHGLDVAHSLCDYDWGVLRPYLAGGTEKPLAAVRFWKDQNMKLLNFKNKIKDRLYMIRYEDLTTRPRPVLMQLFEFLDEPWQEGVLSYNEYAHDPGFEDEKVRDYEKIECNSGNYKNWPPDLQKRLHEEARTLFVALDYTLSGKADSSGLHYSRPMKETRMRNNK